MWYLEAALSHYVMHPSAEGRHVPPKQAGYNAQLELLAPVLVAEPQSPLAE